MIEVGKPTGISQPAFDDTIYYLVSTTLLSWFQLILVHSLSAHQRAYLCPSGRDQATICHS